MPAVTASNAPLGLNTTDVGAALSVKGEPDTDVSPPEEATENIEIVSVLLFAAANTAPVGLNATEVADGSGGEPPSGASAPELATENSSVPRARSPPLGLNARPDPPLGGEMSGEPGARVYASSLATAALGASRQIATTATPSSRRRPRNALRWSSSSGSPVAYSAGTALQTLQAQVSSNYPATSPYAFRW